MIGKLKKGASFGGCVRYVTGKDEAKILASDGVLLGTNAEIVQSFELQRQLNPRIKKPVGHIALSFKPDDKPRLTDDFMAKIALEYMQMMGINDTQFIIVRHHNTDNPHCHIVYNRINNEGKLISNTPKSTMDYILRKAAKTVPKPIPPKIMILCHQRELLPGAHLVIDAVIHDMTMWIVGIVMPYDNAMPHSVRSPPPSKRHSRLTIVRRG